jgi:hypothetical protein
MAFLVDKLALQASFRVVCGLWVEVHLTVLLVPLHFGGRDIIPFLPLTVACPVRRSGGQTLFPVKLGSGLFG